MNKFSNLSSLLSLIIFYFTLIALIMFFAYQVLNNQAADNNLYVTVLWVTAIVIPGVLLASIVVNLLRLFRERRTHVSGAALKTRLVLYFLILVILSAGPQALLSLSFIRTIGDTWFSDKIGEGLQNSLDITTSVQKSLSDDLESFIYSALFESLSERAVDNPERFFIQLRQIRPSIAATQIFSLNGEALYSGGDETAGIEYSDILRSQEGLVIRDIRQDRNFVRIQRTINDLIIVLMEELPSDFGEKTLQILEASELFTEYQEIKDLLYTGILVFYGLFSLPLFFLAILAGFYFSNALIQPIVDLENAIRKVAMGDFSFRILSRSQEELGHIVESFNLMVAELEHSRNQLVQSERITAWKDIAQRLAHEIKNPLTPIKLSAERLQRKYDQGSEEFARILTTSIKTIAREVDHLDTLITEFRDFARLPLPQPQTVNLLQTVKEVFDMHQTANITMIAKDIDENTTIYVDPAQFRQVLGNLVRNAIEAIGEHTGELRVDSQLLTAGGKQFHRIQIQDNGSGIHPDQLSEIFNPYFTSKENGTGLGLAIVQRIVQDHNGEIWVESDPGRGTRFFIDIPILENR